MHIVVGLGNPGPRYVQTRHNIGFMVLDRLARRAGNQWKRISSGSCQTTKLMLDRREVLLVKPQSYMNCSGPALAGLAKEKPYDVADLLLVLDDFLLDFGRLRIRGRGSDGGHNGLASILEEMGTTEIPRLRVGIGPPQEGEEVTDYVLSPFAAGDDLGELVAHAATAVEVCLNDGLEPAMNRFNG